MVLGQKRKVIHSLIHFVKMQNRKALFGRVVKQIEPHIDKDYNPRRKKSTGAFCY